MQTGRCKVEDLERNEDEIRRGEFSKGQERSKRKGVLEGLVVEERDGVMCCAEHRKHGGCRADRTRQGVSPELNHLS